MPDDSGKISAMKKALLSLIITAAASGIHAQALDRSMRPKPGPAPEVKLGKTESFTLPNGLRVFVVENHKLPVITASIQLDVRPALEGNAAGYQDLMGELITSGTKSRSKEALNVAIDNLGARVSASPTSIYGNSLKRFQDNLLELLGDMVLNSDFQQSELEKIKTQTASALESQRNNPDAMLANITSVVNFGNEHPYGEITTDATLQNITLDRCKSYYNTYWRPNVAYMAIVGDVTVPEMKPLIEKYFGGWKRAEVPRASYKTPAPVSKTTVALANRNSAVQSVFNVTYPIILKPGEPDVIKAKVANAVLGGGSQGRLFLNLREAHGWTYGSYSNIREDDLAGSFTGYAKCRNAVTDSSITEMLKEMKRIKNEPITQQELQSRITYMIGNFAIGLENPQTVAQYAINIERYKMPKNYYTDYLKNLSAVTTADVQRISQKYVSPENAHIIVVGNAGEIAPKLAAFGAVEAYDNYGHKLSSEQLKAAPTGITAAEVTKKYIDAIGGEKAIGSIRDMKVVRSFDMQKGSFTMTEYKKSPDAFVRKIEGMGQVLSKTTYASGKGYMEARGSKAELVGAELEGAREQADLQARLHPEKFGITRSLKGMEKVDGKEMYVIEKKGAAGRKSTEYYDVSTGLLAKEVSTKSTIDGDIVQESEFLNYKEVPGSGGFKIAYTVNQTSGPQHFIAEVKSVEVNKGISDSEFK